MKEKEIIENLKAKIRETKEMTGLNSKSFRFRNWQISTMNLLRSLPSDYAQQINDFKKLNFEDTKFHRGKKFAGQGDNTKFREGLDSAGRILESITAGSKKGYDAKKAAEGIAPEKNDLTGNIPENDGSADGISESPDMKKPVKPPEKTKPGGNSSSKKAGSATAKKTGFQIHEPAKKGKSTSGKKKKS